MIRLSVGLSLILLVSSVHGQDLSLKFEVASVRISVSPNSIFRGGPGTSNPTRATWTSYTMKNLIAFAFQVHEDEIVWSSANDTRYDILANVAPGASESQVPAMLQDLLSERFDLKVHRDLRSVPGFQVLIAKSGLKMKVSERQASQQSPLPTAVTLDRQGFPDMPQGIPSLTHQWSGQHARTTGVSQTMREIIAFIKAELDGKPVEDRTGLVGSYDFKLHYAMRESIVEKMKVFNRNEEPPLEDPGPAPELAAALEEQLGLKLQSSKPLIEMIVVDNVRKTPREN